jgi:hypothetical protein
MEIEMESKRDVRITSCDFGSKSFVFKCKWMGLYLGDALSFSMIRFTVSGTTEGSPPVMFNLFKIMR